MTRRAVTAIAVLMWGLAAGAAAEPVPELRARAGAALDARRWTEALPLYRDLTAASPHDGGLWRRYALCAIRTGAFDTAVDACRRALETGQAPAETWYDMACALALAGRRDPALDALERAFAAGFCDPHLVAGDADLASLRDAPRFRDITGAPDPAVTGRRAHWMRDLRFLARRVREVHWRPFAVIPEAVFDARIDAIVASIDDRSDLELRLDIQRLLAAIGDGHTTVVPDFFLMHHGGHPGDVRVLPVEFFEYDDDVRMVAAAPELERFIGARVRAVGDVDIVRVLDGIDPCVSRDNVWGARWGRMQALADPRILEGLGLGTLRDGFRFALEPEGASPETVTIAAAGAEALHALRSLPGHFGMPAGPAFARKGEHLHLETLAGGNTLYARIDGIRDGGDESFAAFTERIFATADTAGSEALILDLRDNPGGQGHLATPLLHRLISSERFNRRGSLFVLAGRKTFSAAMALAAQLDLRTAAMFAGEPTGSRPNFVGEASLVRLPYSGIQVSLSSRYHQNGDSNDRRLWIAPDLPAPPAFAAEREGRDPALEAVLGYLAGGRRHD